MKPPIPDMNLEASDVVDIKTLSTEELDNTPYEKKKWCCCIEDCSGYATIRDYGISPFFYWRRQWLNLTEQILYCSKHWPLFRKSGRDDSKFNYKEGVGINHLI